MDTFALEAAVAAVFRILDAANEFIASNEPWVLARDAAKADRLGEVLFEVAEAVRVAAVLLLPVMPRSAAEILRRVGERKPREEIRLIDAVWRNDGERVILMGDPLWPRAEIDKRAPGVPSGRVERKQRSNSVDETEKKPVPVPIQAPPPPAPAPMGPITQEQPAATAGDQISIDDFMKVDLRVAKVLAAEKVANSRKLVKLTIDAGVEHRTLVAGIAEAYEAEALVGRTIVMVFNLKPAKLMGIESNGMVLAASPEGGRPTLVGFDQDVPPGTRVR
jgi:methionyl-tRNA synthetase